MATPTEDRLEIRNSVNIDGKATSIVLDATLSTTVAPGWWLFDVELIVHGPHARARAILNDGEQVWRSESYTDGFVLRARLSLLGVKKFHVEVENPGSEFIHVDGHIEGTRYREPDVVTRLGFVS